MQQNLQMEPAIYMVQFTQNIGFVTSQLVKSIAAFPAHATAECIAVLCPIALTEGVNKISCSVQLT